MILDHNTHPHTKTEPLAFSHNFSLETTLKKLRILLYPRDDYLKFTANQSVRRSISFYFIIFIIYYPRHTQTHGRNAAAPWYSALAHCFDAGPTLSQCCGDEYHLNTVNPLSPHDASKHHFTSLKTDLIFLQSGF